MPEWLDAFQMPLWAKLLIVLPALGFPVVILLFILRNEYAHDESRCPYEVLTVERHDAGIEIVEERRSCLSNVEDRRYSARRSDSVHVMGKRRLPPEAFKKPGYQWTAELRQGQMHLTVITNGHPTAEFREGTAEERAY